LLNYETYNVVCIFCAIVASVGLRQIMRS